MRLTEEASSGLRRRSVAYQIENLVKMFVEFILRRLPFVMKSYRVVQSFVHKQI